MFLLVNPKADGSCEVIAPGMDRSVVIDREKMREIVNESWIAAQVAVFGGVIDGSPW